MEFLIILLLCTVQAHYSIIEYKLVLIINPQYLMNKITIMILLVFVAFSGFSQTDSDYQNAINTISEGYNANDPNKIFGTFSSDLQSKLALEQLQKMIENYHASKGTMGDSTFLLEENGVKRYLTEFENISSVLVLKLSSDNKLTEFAIEEY